MASWKKILTSGSAGDVSTLTTTGAATLGGTLNVAGAVTLTTDLGVTHGGTGASNAADARTNLGLVIGQDVQAYDAQLADLAGLSVTSGSFIVGDGTNFVLDSGASVASKIGVGAEDSPTFVGITATGNTTAVSASAAYLKSSGIVTASAFYGDGSGLTNLVSDIGSLTDVGTSNVGVAKTILVSDGDSFEGVQLSGDVTISTAGVATLKANPTSITSLTKVTTMGEGGDNVDFDGGITVDEASTFDNNLAVGGTHTVTGQTILNGGLVMDTNKFIVADTTGNTTIAGTLDAGGKTTIGGTSENQASAGVLVNGIYEQVDGKDVGLKVHNNVSASGFIGQFYDIVSTTVVSEDDNRFGNDDTDTATFSGDIRIETGSSLTGPDSSNSWMSGSGDSTITAEGITKISGSVDQKVDFRSALGGVTGSFVGKFRGDGSGLTGIGTSLTYKNTGGSDFTTNLLTETLEFSGSDGISITAADDKITIDGVDASATVKGVSQFSATSFDVNSGNVSVKSGSIDTDALAADAVTGTKIADNAIDSEHYTDGSIDAEHLASDSVTTVKILNANVTTDKIANANVTTDKIANSNVTTDKLAADAVTGTKIADNAIDSEHYTDASIDTAHIADDQVTNAKLANITRGSVKVGGASNAPTDLDAKGDGKILVGDGTDVKSVSVSGAGTLSNAGVLTLGSDVVTATQVDSDGAFNMGSLTTSGNVTVGGNLSVTGTVTQTEVQQIQVADNFILLNDGATGNNIDSGITIQRDANNFASMYMDLTAGGRWAVASGSSQPDAESSITHNAFIPTVSQSTSSPNEGSRVVPQYGKSGNYSGEMCVDTSTDEIWIYVD